MAVGSSFMGVRRARVYRLTAVLRWHAGGYKLELSFSSRDARKRTHQYL